MNHRLHVLLALFLFASLAQADSWYRGNTHTHTTLTDGDSAPEVVAKWYHDRGYNFLCISSHNKFFDPAIVTMPENKRKDFILIAGEEITGPHRIHMTAFNISSVVDWNLEELEKGKEVTTIIQNYVDRTHAVGGVPILNHPNFFYGVKATDVLPVKGLRLLEVFNGHPDVHNGGDDEHPSTEEMWDELLTRGMTIFGVASDDAHIFKKWARDISNPDRGWVMVRSNKLNADAIAAAMLCGDFYSSTGVFLKTCKRTGGVYKVQIDTRRTQQELSSSEHLRGTSVPTGKEGYAIEFIGPGGKVLQRIEGTRAAYKARKSDSYVRARVTYTHRHPKFGLEQYFAWGQPLFTDLRAEGK